MMVMIRVDYDFREEKVFLHSQFPIERHPWAHRVTEPRRRQTAHVQYGQGSCLVTTEGGKVERVPGKRAEWLCGSALMVCGGGLV